MIALVRYAFLKTSRDGSFWAFALMPVLFPVAALVGGTVAQSHSLHYPFVLGRNETAQAAATTTADLTTMLCAMFAILPGFWTFRSEIATKAIGSFALAARPISIVVMVIVSASGLMCFGWLAAYGMILLLTTAWPAHFALNLLRVVIASICAASIGIAGVAVSVEASMVIGIYAAAIGLIVWVEKAKTAVAFSIPLIATVILAAVATFFLERRCAH